MTKRLYKSESNKAVSGVIGGVGEYFDLDPVLLRVVWILVVVFTGIFPGVIAYIFAALIVPHRSEHKKVAKAKKTTEENAA
ncbi:MAG: Phage shock protein C, PspC [Candidatus Wolfebacteria bacterium GW2011_GWE1_48_7]|uniref:Phage shock protein C, PspC n=2 Tax=Candidatus Wolfeibacteriota TaxID=1752735 RepID=A0A0G1WIK8_9BACT|nr:MAG: phage shock protein C [Candidatus Wolfebacteria bacterium GW2011_GWB1_47_1]KKU36678.1 MAG: Phage shock protein C, PspC [Candidatus Wolfebacteria bacterium GW2011_GWC2_46_275]KKU42358.1 MAG: Phage shock protein C, PspC [Candidatus Wolfebacteria bacterium GW2011_GWB2_46_69]KKU54324.1 MAG: Phage shock protein C, PspC [Candidatus Wolfebacteria bacterium GW2011_GWC1_47_103]KKU58880.1 MAG: Phage shock protein C, PspC [Candidatus Wolfebacteria bacterium GW2011_GWE2_47_12]KKU66155.1 MAG: Phage